MKPHLRKLYGKWLCVGDTILGTGTSPSEAYYNWHWRHRRRTAMTFIWR